jgi:hypothetical protein
VTHYRWDSVLRDFVEYDPHEERSARCSRPWGPMIVRDTPAYKSPLGDGKVIDGRAARREHLKANGCREVEPGEFPVEYWNPKFAAKHGKKVTPRSESKLRKREIDINID